MATTLSTRARQFPGIPRRARHRPGRAGTAGSPHRRRRGARPGPANRWVSAAGPVV